MFALQSPAIFRSRLLFRREQIPLHQPEALARGLNETNSCAQIRFDGWRVRSVIAEAPVRETPPRSCRLRESAYKYVEWRSYRRCACLTSALLIASFQLLNPNVVQQLIGNR